MPLLLSKQISSFSAYAIWNIQETNSQLLEMFNGQYPENLHPTKLSEWLVSQILLQQICKKFNIKYTGITKNEAGKPFLKGSSAQISISHSFPMAGVMINLNKSCGLDIERERAALPKIQHKFLHKSEKKHKDQLSELCAIWCAKEVLYKIYGRRQLSFRDDLKVRLGTGDYITGYILKGGFEETIKIKYESLKDYFLAYSV